MFLTRYCEKIVAGQRFAASTEPLDLMKFICKEFWEEVFKRKVVTIY
jgi:Transport protein particle (TRAPP) component